MSVAEDDIGIDGLGRLEIESMNEIGAANAKRIAIVRSEKGVFGRWLTGERG